MIQNTSKRAIEVGLVLSSRFFEPILGHTLPKKIEKIPFLTEFFFQDQFWNIPWRVLKKKLKHFYLQFWSQFDFEKSLQKISVFEVFWITVKKWKNTTSTSKNEHSHASLGIDSLDMPTNGLKLYAWLAILETKKAKMEKIFEIFFTRKYLKQKMTEEWPSIEINVLNFTMKYMNKIVNVD